MAFEDLGASALRYELAGDGADTLVLIHELGGSLESWDAVMPRLPHRLRIVRYDLRGAGLSEKLRGPVDFADMSDDLARLLDRIGIDGPVFLAGCAVGGGIALDFASRVPGRVRGVVAMAPAVSISSDRRESALAFAAAIETDGLRPLVEMAVERAFATEVKTDPAVIAGYVARWLGNDARSYAETYRMVIRSDLDRRLGGIRCPVLAVAGSHDVVRPATLVKATAAALPHADYRMLASGHFMPVQSPVPVADAIGAFLAAQGV